MHDDEHRPGTVLCQEPAAPVMRRHLLPLLLATCCSGLYKPPGEWTRALAEGLLAATFGTMPPSGAYLAAAPRPLYNVPRSTPTGGRYYLASTGRSDSGAWLYQLPFSTGSTSCDLVLAHDPELHRCRASAAVFWTGGGPKDTCCFIWSLVDCMERTVRARCDPYHRDTFNRQRLDYVARVQTNPVCFHYPYGNWHCYLRENWILIVAFVVLAGFILVCVAAALWLFFCRKRCCPPAKSGGTFRDDLFAAEYDIERRRQSTPRAHVARTTRHHLDDDDVDLDEYERRSPGVTVVRHAQV